MQGLIVEVLQWIQTAAALSFKKELLAIILSLHLLVIRTTLDKGAGLILEGLCSLFCCLMLEVIGEHSIERFSLFF